MSIPKNLLLTTPLSHVKASFAVDSVSREDESPEESQRKLSDEMSTFIYSSQLDWQDSDASLYLQKKNSVSDQIQENPETLETVKDKYKVLSQLLDDDSEDDYQSCTSQLMESPEDITECGTSVTSDNEAVLTPRQTV